MNSDLITVIVPVYNTEKYLSRCVNSIMSQTYKNIEIILVDDGSPDGSPKLCDELANCYDNIRVIHQKNAGASVARNTGIENSRGKYLAFVDSDDYINSGMIQRLYQLINLHKADVAMLQYLEVNEKTVIPQVKDVKEQIFMGKEVEKAFLSLKIESACVGLYSRKAIGSIRFPRGRTSEDISFNFNIFRQIRCFVYVPEQRYYYYYNIESTSNGCLDKHMFSYLDIREKIYSFYKNQKDDMLLKMSEELYARAAMGLLTRMALFGISDELDESVEYNRLRNILQEHEKSFFLSQTIPLSRKFLGFAGLHAYGLLKIIGRMKQ